MRETSAPAAAVIARVVAPPLPHERAALLQLGGELAARWPASMDEARQRAFDLAQDDPLAALTLLQPLRGRNFPGITAWEREIMLGWAQRDLAALYAGLEASYRSDRPLAEHWVSLAASIVQNERRDALPDMLHWIDAADHAGAIGLALLATNKLVTHLTAESADAVITFLAPRAADPMYRDTLVQLAGNYAHQAPEQALNRIQSYPDASVRRDALLAVVSAVTWDAPTKVLEWLNSGTLLINAGMTDLSATDATKLRDEVLTTYFTSLVSSHPGYVAQYANAVMDPAARQYLLNMADVMARTERRTPTDLWVRDADIKPDSLPARGHSNP